MNHVLAKRGSFNGILRTVVKVEGISRDVLPICVREIVISDTTDLIQHSHLQTL